ncbi:MAG TPA: dihydrofolate reductase [Phycisphaerales bacterium]|nr:dihydrofolate reductase [Phycisphaerales bacterium]
MHVPLCSMRLAIIVAMSENRVIGRGGGLPWHLPDDLRHFKRTTKGHVVVMGRRTFDSIGRMPLPGRTNIIITRDRNYEAPGAQVSHSFAEAVTLAQRCAPPDAEVFVLGGADIFRLALPVAHKLYLTLVHATIEGDVHFPEFDLTAWRLIDETQHAADANHAYPFSIQTYERSRPDRTAS